MCGIAGFMLKEGASYSPTTLERLADELLFGIDERGGDACGFAARAADGRLVVQKASCRAYEFTVERSWFPSDVRTVLLHTRFATQGHEAFPENNHPVNAGPIYCVHNGHVSNDYELIRASGIDRIGRVDSEAIPATVARRGWENAGRAMSELEGAAAVALLQADTGELILARGYSSPLVVVENDSLIVWASTESAIRSAWKAVLGTPPRGGRFVHVGEGTLLRYASSGKRTTETFVPHEPAYTYRTFGGPSGGSYRSPAVSAAPRMGAADAARLEGMPTPRPRVAPVEWWDEDDIPRVGTLEECTCCGDFFPASELESVTYEAWRVCEGCARWFGGALDHDHDPTAV